MSQCPSVENELVGREPVLLVHDTVPRTGAFQTVHVPLACTSAVLVTWAAGD